MRIFAVLAAVAAWAVAPGPASGSENASLKAFVGTWGGSAIATNRDSIYFGVTLRDLDVTIAGDDRSFQITWTTVFRRGGTPENPTIRRKTTTLAFAAVAPGLFESRRNNRAGPGRTYSWARIEGNSLIVYLFMVNRNGVYEVARYDRTVSGTGMALRFSSIRDGEPIRTVTGRLVRHR